jgi:ketosteroid isomerase-like protein
MPTSNIDVARSVYGDWSRGDFDSAEWLAPDIEFVIADGPAPDHARGLDGMVASVRDLMGGIDELKIEAQDFRTLEGDRVLVLIRFSGRFRKSGIALEQTGSLSAHVWHVQDGKATKLVLYWDRDRALAELGIAD